MRHLWTLLLLAFVIGCGSGSQGELVPLDQVPEPMLKTAKKTLPDVTFDHARKLPNGNYDPRVGHELYQRYFDLYERADEFIQYLLRKAERIEEYLTQR